MFVTDFHFINLLCTASSDVMLSSAEKLARLGASMWIVCYDQLRITWSLIHDWPMDFSDFATAKQQTSLVTVALKKEDPNT
jgi:hypothetical protein